MNEVIAKNIEEYCHQISDDVIDVVLERYSNVSGDDEFFIEEAISRVSTGTRPSVMASLYYEVPEFLFEFSQNSEDVSEITVTIAVYFTDESFSVSADNTPVDCSPVGMHINVFLPEEKDFLEDEEYDFIFQEIENSVRHEFEHVIQAEFPALVHNVDYHKIDFRPGREETSKMAYYLTQPSEVSAHVQGYYQISLSENEFYSRVLKLLSKYVELNYISEDERFRIFLCWKDWFTRNIYICNGSGEAQCAK